MVVEDIENTPLKVYQERRVILKNKICVAKILTFGSEMACQQALAELTNKNLKIIESGHDNCLEGLKKENLRLQQENKDLKEKLKSIIAKCEEYKKVAEKYEIIRHFINSNNDSINKDTLTDLSQEVIIDSNNPLIIINRAQYDALCQLKTPGSACRYLMDIFFEKEEFDNKNASKLSQEFPEKISVIKNFVT